MWHNLPSRETTGRGWVVWPGSSPQKPPSWIVRRFPKSAAAQALANVIDEDAQQTTGQESAAGAI